MERYVTIYNQFTVKEAINKLTNKVSSIIEEKGAENCIFVSVLNGGAYLTHKILDKLGQGMLAELQVENVKVSSYHGKERGSLEFEYMPKIDCKGKTIIVIDDICDSGSTTNVLHNYFTETGAENVYCVVLVARDKRQVNQDVNLIYGIDDHTGAFFIGCGMDDNGKSRYINSLIAKV